MKPLTVQEVMEKVAKKNSFETWQDAKNEWLKRTGWACVVHQEYIGQAAQLFGDSQWNAALEKAAEIAVDTSFESLSDFNNFLEELKRLKR